ncbi:hypothetical protein KQH51_05145 [bacterium]|nr:hypothetical protein [bacterium]MCB2202302.1 hypothetical protein [bacterium]
MAHEDVHHALDITMHHFSTIIKFSRTAVPLNMLLLAAIIFVSVTGPTEKLIPWGFVAFGLLMCGVFALDLTTMHIMGRQSKRLRETLRIIGYIATIGLCLYVVVIAVTATAFLESLLTPITETAALAIVFVDLMVVASVGRR